MHVSLPRTPPVLGCNTWMTCSRDGMSPFYHPLPEALRYIDQMRRAPRRTESSPQLPLHLSDQYRGWKDGLWLFRGLRHNKLTSASALMLCLPGLYLILRLNLKNNKVNRACRAFNLPDVFQIPQRRDVRRQSPCCSLYKPAIVIGKLQAAGGRKCNPRADADGGNHWQRCRRREPLAAYYIYKYGKIFHITTAHTTPDHTTLHTILYTAFHYLILYHAHHTI